MSCVHRSEEFQKVQMVRRSRIGSEKRKTQHHTRSPCLPKDHKTAQRNKDKNRRKPLRTYQQDIQINSAKAQETRNLKERTIDQIVGLRLLFDKYSHKRTRAEGSDGDSTERWSRGGEEEEVEEYKIEESGRVEGGSGYHKFFFSFHGFRRRLLGAATGVVGGGGGLFPWRASDVCARCWRDRETRDVQGEGVRSREREREGGGGTGSSSDTTGEGRDDLATLRRWCLAGTDDTAA